MKPPRPGLCFVGRVLAIDSVSLLALLSAFQVAALLQSLLSGFRKEMPLSVLLGILSLSQYFSVCGCSTPLTLIL